MNALYEVAGVQTKRARIGRKPPREPEPEPEPEPEIKDNIKQPTDDDNDSIIKLIQERTSSYDNKGVMLEKLQKRLDFGRKKYGHGVKINNDTSKYTKDWDECSAQNWLMMAYEEMLDGCVYFSAEILRATNADESSKYITKLEKALKYCIKSLDLLLEAEALK